VALAVPVGAQDGVFTVDLDFGVDPYVADTQYWLEIDVAAAGTGAYATLSPRQTVNAVPRSLSTRGLAVDNQNRVGIGTFAPLRMLDVQGTMQVEPGSQGDANNAAGTTLRTVSPGWQSFTATRSGELRQATVALRNATAWSGTATIFAGEGIGGTVLGTASTSGPAGTVAQGVVAVFAPGLAVLAGQVYTVNIGAPATAEYLMSESNPYPSGRASAGSGIDLVFSTVVKPSGLYVNDTGRVGIGTALPTAELEVRGGIRLGSTGELRAPGAEEDLRIIRGTAPLSGAGSGPGFTSSPLGFGNLSVQFTKPFSGVPTVVVSPSGQFTVSVASVTTGNFLVQFPSSAPGGATVSFIVAGPR
jgi:hypothetical protein